MESVTSMTSFAVSVYFILNIGIWEWFAYSISRSINERYKLFSLNFSLVWNIFTSTLLMLISISIPFLYCFYKRSWASAFKVSVTIILLMAGPVLLVCTFVGSDFETIDYSFLCENKDCVRLI